MTYEVVWREQASKAFQKLDRVVQRRVQQVVDRLAENPKPGQATQLTTDPRTWRVRAGDWRILYEIDGDRLVVLILDLGHRSTIYGS
jgi:mRNA interferase RelE/StbE